MEIKYSRCSIFINKIKTIPTRIRRYVIVYYSNYKYVFDFNIFIYKYIHTYLKANLTHFAC